MAEWVDGTGQRIRNVHHPSQCAGRPCVIHHPSEHSMREFPTHFRDDRGFMERICPHGIGHPDPDDPGADPVHGCDGCCAQRVTPAQIEDVRHGLDRLIDDPPHNDA